MTDAFIRPDPARGRPGDAAYARLYATSHRVVADEVAYRAGYLDILTLDGLLPDGYSLLDVGCGTAGYHRLATRAGAILGLDLTPAMIEEAERLRAESGETHRRYVCATFESTPFDEPFDAIRFAGIYGWYRPWHGARDVLARLSGLLRPGGVVAVSYTPPRTPLQGVKAMLAPSRTVLIFRGRFLAMLRGAGLAPLCEIRLPHTVLTFARKPPDQPAGPGGA